MTFHFICEQIDHGLQVTFGVCAIVSVIGYFWTVFFVEDEPDKVLKMQQSGLEPDDESTSPGLLDHAY